MSKDSFKVKKGLTLTPIDPADITNPQPGDLISDSTDDNKIKKYDETSAEWTAVGGSAGIGGNLMSDFENLTPTVSNVTSATDTVTFLPIDDNNKSIKATWAGSVGSIQYQVALDSSLQEIQGTVSVWLRTSLSDIQISSVQDGTKISTLPVTGNNKWKQYEIPMVLGGSNVGFIVESLTAQTGDVYIDEAFVGLTPSSYAFDVAQVERFGKASWVGTANCQWAATIATIGTYQNLLEDLDCNDPTVEGRLQPPSSKILGVVLPAGSPAGTYNFRFNGRLRNEAQVVSICSFRFSDGTNSTESSTNYSGSGNDSESTTLIGSITYDTALTVDTTVQIQATANSSGQICNHFHDKAYDTSALEVIYYPPQSTIVTQVQTLDVNTANHFSAKVSDSGVISDENLDWLSSCSWSPVGTLTCIPQPNIFTNTPNCTIVGRGSRDVGNFTDSSSSSSSLVFSMRRQDTGDLLNQFVTIKCDKQGADYNKSAMIVGNFEQIKTTELCRARYYGNDGEAISANTEDFPFKTLDTTVGDNCGIFTNAGNTGQNTNDAIVPIRSGFYLISAAVDEAGANDTVFSLYKDNLEHRVMGGFAQSGVDSRYSVIGGHYYLEEGSIYTIRATDSMTLDNSNSQVTHWINIAELGDTAALIKNLNDNKTVKCQTKILSADFSNSTASIPDLSFSNLTIGKKYKLTGTALFRVDDSGEVRLEFEHNGSILTKTRLNTVAGGSGLTQYAFTSKELWTATATTVTANGISGSTSRAIFGNGTLDETFATLCELPDFYIETDEW